MQLPDCALILPGAMHGVSLHQLKYWRAGIVLATRLLAIEKYDYLCSLYLFLGRRVTNSVNIVLICIITQDITIQYITIQYNAF